MKSILPNTKTRKIIIRKAKSLLDWRGHYQDLKDKLSPTKTMHIEMFLRNGKSEEFLIRVDETELFNYNNSTYIVDVTCAINSTTSDGKKLFYHEDVTLPLKIDIDADKIKNQKEYLSIKAGLNPRAFVSFMRSTIIERINNGGKFEEAIDTILKYAKYILFLCAGIILLILWSSGVIAV